MALSSGARLGPYEILASLGAGGMGEVYRARDPRLGRDVAIKVLPASFSTDPDRLKRFEQEARAAGILNHPNITAVYDVGTDGGAPYVVSELLEGETLRARLAAGDVPARKAVDFAIQIAHGLAAAHEKGIVHRDLKPENLFVTKDGRVKILDFGLAKLTHPEKPGVPLTEVPTRSAGTDPGVVLGTVGYMSPEQVRGLAVDSASDLFAFGAILYEMLSGRRAFHGATAADTLSAILREEPPDLALTVRDLRPGLDRIVRHCLEKTPEERFHSAHDLAFDLEMLSGISGPTAAVPVPKAGRKPVVRRVLITAAAILAAAAAGAFLYAAGRRAGYAPPPTFHQLSFRRGEVSGASFTPDGQTVIYSAAWEGRPMEMFASRLESPESRPFGLPGDVLAMSPSGEMAVSLDDRPIAAFIRSGRLARINIAGGAPREILDGVEWADWSPDRKDLAIVRTAGAHNRLEYPIDKVLYQTDGWIGHPRFSPDGERIAFIDHPISRDDAGTVAVVERSGKLTRLTPIFETAQGLAWAPGGREIWFTAAETGYNRAIHAVDLSGRQRLIGRVPGVSTIKDIWRDGRVLLSSETVRVELRAGRAAGPEESDLSWLDWSVATDISPDGKTVLFSEAGEGGGPGYSACLRKMDGSPGVRLGEGFTHGFSPDGKWALCVLNQATVGALVAVPTSVGETRKLESGGLRVLVADWLPDGKHIVITAQEAGRGKRLYLQNFDGGAARALSPEGYRQFERTVSPDGKFVAARGPDMRTYLYPLEGGEPTLLSGLTAADTPVRFDGEGRRLYVTEGDLPLRVYRYEISSGRRELWKKIQPPDPVGVSFVGRFVTTPDGQAYAYDYFRILSYLQVVGGLK
ncbi:MAG TPA: protein kinase [Thermoanaerobaculia bacterium]|nr:protein kinase [Thermoanaerobaculia bacterium]